MTRHTWTMPELNKLRQLIRDGYPTREAAAVLGLSIDAITNAITYYKIMRPSGHWNRRRNIRIPPMVLPRLTK